LLHKSDADPLLIDQYSRLGIIAIRPGSSAWLWFGYGYSVFGPGIGMVIAIAGIPLPHRETDVAGTQHKYGQ